MALLYTDSEVCLSPEVTTDLTCPYIRLKTERQNSAHTSLHMVTLPHYIKTKQKLVWQILDHTAFKKHNHW